jgi:hypothetical protein
MHRRTTGGDDRALRADGFTAVNTYIGYVTVCNNLGMAHAARQPQRIRIGPHQDCHHRRGQGPRRALDPPFREFDLLRGCADW